MSATPAEHVAALPADVKDAARVASSAGDDSLLNYVFGQVGAMIKGGATFGQDQLGLITKTATDVLTQLNSAAQQAIASVDQTKLKAAADTALGVHATVTQGASQAASNVKSATTTLASNVQASASKAAAIAQPQVESAVASVKTAVGGIPAAASAKIEAARSTALGHVDALASKATAAVAGATKATTDAQTKAVELSGTAQVKAQEYASVAAAASVQAVDRLHDWLKEQHAHGKDVNATHVQRVVAALASTEAAKMVQKGWEDIKAKQQAAGGAPLNMHEVQQQVAAQAASNAVTAVSAATAGKSA